MTAEVNRCERCGDPYEPTQETQRYCSGRCREAAKKRRSRLRPLAAKLLGTTGDTGDMSLMDLAERAGPGRREDVRDDLDQAHASDYADALRGDEHADETSERISGYLNHYIPSRERHGLWSQWKQLGRKNGVQPQAQVDDRVARRRAAEKETLDRLTNAPGQVENRFNPVTRNVVAEAGRASRKLNSYKRRADDMPRDMQGPVCQPRMEPQAISRGGHGCRAYSWQMRDGW